jgi:hypothetical protein
MRVLPRHLPVGVAHLPFSGYQGLISRSPTWRPAAGTPGEPTRTNRSAWVEPTMRSSLQSTGPIRVRGSIHSHRYNRYTRRGRTSPSRSGRPIGNVAPTSPGVTQLQAFEGLGLRCGVTQDESARSGHQDLNACSHTRIQRQCDDAFRGALIQPEHAIERPDIVGFDDAIRTVRLHLTEYAYRPKQSRSRDHVSPSIAAARRGRSCSQHYLGMHRFDSNESLRVGHLQKLKANRKFQAHLRILGVGGLSGTSFATVPIGLRPAKGHENRSLPHERQ